MVFPSCWRVMRSSAMAARSANTPQLSEFGVAWRKGVSRKLTAKLRLVRIYGHPICGPIAQLLHLVVEHNWQPQGRGDDLSRLACTDKRAGNEHIGSYLTGRRQPVAQVFGLGYTKRRQPCITNEIMYCPQ